MFRKAIVIIYQSLGRKARNAARGIHTTPVNRDPPRKWDQCGCSFQSTGENLQGGKVAQQLYMLLKMRCQDSFVTAQDLV